MVSLSARGTRPCRRRPRRSARAPFPLERPTVARLGLANTAVGTFSWSTAVGSPRNSVRASHIASAVATGVRLMRLVTSPTAWIEGTLRARVLVDDHRAIGGELHARRLEAELRRIRPPAGGEHHEVGALDRAVGELDLDLAAAFGARPPARSRSGSRRPWPTSPRRCACRPPRRSRAAGACRGRRASSPRPGRGRSRRTRARCSRRRPRPRAAAGARGGMPRST